VAVGDGVYVDVGDGVYVGVGVKVKVSVGDAVAVNVALFIGVTVGVAEGDRQNMEPVATTVLLVSSTSNVRVPKSPLVLILKVCPAVSWNVFCAIGVPFKLMRQVKGVVISPPVLVMVISPSEFGAQVPLTWKAGAIAALMLNPF
jgi:hypothetical protein